ncbi:MAG: cytochrome c, partial [Deltaproteobacteria bacterium]|nr:cytochrome c [Deltaproteobacteria bacterium]
MTSTKNKALLGIASLSLLLVLTACGGSGGEMSADAKAGEEVFKRNCTACHTVGSGDRIGPDLQGVSQRRDRDWLVSWLDDPVGMGKNDPVGQELLAQWNNVPMSDSNLSPEEINQVIA